MAVTADEILRAARARVAPLTGETAGYFVLGAADGLVDAEGRLVDAAVGLTEDGTVRVGRVDAGSCAELESGLRGLLARLLSYAPPGVPALVRVSRVEAPRGVEHLVSELEAALIPVNRSAARRALARLCRDVARAKNAGKLPEAEPSLAASPLPPPAAVKPAAAAVKPATPAPAAAALTSATQPPGPVAAPVAPVVVEIPPPPLVEFTPRLETEFAGPGRTPIVEAVQEVSTRVDTPAIPFAAVTPSVAPLFPLAASPVSLDDAVVEPEKTPFLGAWPGAAPVGTALRPQPSDEHDTEHAPPVAFDDDELPLSIELELEDALGDEAPVELDERDEAEGLRPEGAKPEEIPPAESVSAPLAEAVPAPRAVLAPCEESVSTSAAPEESVSDAEETAWMTALFGGSPSEDADHDALTPEAWAREGDVMPDEPIVFGGRLGDESPRLPEAELRVPRLPPSLELTAPWPPPVEVRAPVEILEPFEAEESIEAVEAVEAVEAEESIEDAKAVEAVEAEESIEDAKAVEAEESIEAVEVLEPVEPPVAVETTPERHVPFFAFEDDEDVPPSEEFAAALRDGDDGIEFAFLPLVATTSPSSDEDVHEALEPLMQAAADAFVSAAGEKEAAAVAASEREASFLSDEPVSAPVKIAVAPYQPRQSDVQQLIAGFGGAADASALTDVTRELQRFAGIGGTPDPGAVVSRPRKANPSRR